MEEREKLWIYILRGAGQSIPKDLYHILRQAILRATEMYVDTLTDKQREAINFIRILPERDFVEGIGTWVEGFAWVSGEYRGRKVYIIDC